MLAINCSNLHVGGGIQVAASFLSEIPIEQKKLISVYASTEVLSDCIAIKTDIGSFLTFNEVNSYGLSNRHAVTIATKANIKCIFTIFGPIYSTPSKAKSIVGFAQPWIIYPSNECYKLLSLITRIKYRLKYWIQGKYFKNSDVLIVELEHVKQGLIRELGIAPERIHVVHNCISSIYLDQSLWRSVEIPDAPCDLKLGFVGRNYLHKNTGIFPAIARELKARHGISAKFYVTFNEDEWKSCSPEFRQACINVGNLAINQCPSFYQAVDAVVFPSLLECFSATPLETMAMGKPLFASDRPFNRDVCGEHANYFDPQDALSAANSIARVFSRSGRDTAALQAARSHALNFSDARSRAEQYLKIIEQYCQ